MAWDRNPLSLHVIRMLRERARSIAEGLALPDFYKDFSPAHKASLDAFETDPVVLDLRAYIREELDEDFGHGVKHVVKVAKDAGALVYIEMYQMGEEDVRRQMVLAQSAGLLHDIRRKEKDHAQRGADFAQKFLADYPFSEEEIQSIACAIRNHEAFRSQVRPLTPHGLLLSNCLYDADKFRWGPDNFTDTVWDMIEFLRPSFSMFMEKYPKGMEKLESIRNTFRSPTGKRYGPQFIDKGVFIGKELYRFILREYPNAGNE